MNEAPSNLSENSTAYHLLEGLNEIGVDHLFCNFGTDHAPIIEEMANRKRRGEKNPSVTLCPHENTAAHMAGGYAFVTGRGQGVLVHVDVGTANVATAMHNLFRSRLPVLLMAGKAPFTAEGELVGSRDTYVHFIQEPFDQGSLVRPYVKWEWTLPSGVVVKEALRRAHNMMESHPQGPVYFMAQRETLTEQWKTDQVKSYPADQFPSVRGGAADGRVVAALADRLLAAHAPILITGYAGRNPMTAKLIEDISRVAGIAVIEGNMTCNVSHENPCFVGYSADQHLPLADVGILVDVDVPWFPSDVRPNPSAFWAHIDVDVLKSASPMWSFPGHVRLAGDSGLILEQLFAEITARATPAFRAAAAERVRSLTAAREARLAKARQLASAPGAADEINPHYLFAELNKHLEPTDLVFNEGVRNAGACLMQLSRPLPNTIMRAGGGGLGWSGGMALGAKLAAPDRMMVQVVGDGSFYFGNPSSVFSVSQHYNLPFLSLVLDNMGWSAVKESTLRVFPDGDAKKANEFQAGLMPEADFTKVGAAFGAYGERVSDPGDLPGAIERCVAEVRSGRTSVLHVRVTRL